MIPFVNFYHIYYIHYFVTILGNSLLGIISPIRAGDTVTLVTV